MRDFGAYSAGGSLELDIYGGYKGTIGSSDFGYDVGMLHYYYPGETGLARNTSTTPELYGALSWKWLTGKHSYSTQRQDFGVGDSQGTYYLDLTADLPDGQLEAAAVIAHYG